MTARQTATRLSDAGHEVHVLSPDPACLCRWTRRVRQVHRVPAYGADPLRWLEAALAVYASGAFDVLLPTQEQVAVLAAVPDRLRAAGVVTAVPPFAALGAVQDKISAFGTLTRLGLPQPRSAVGATGWDDFPAYVKEPIGTASGGVRRVTSPDQLRAATADGRPVLVQAAVTGTLAMCQAVFHQGSLVAFHASLRTGEGAGGGASHKRGVNLPETRAWFGKLGSALDWHGALSADVILTDDGPVFIDVNPRLVEPENAWRSGVDLVGALLEVATGGDRAPAAQVPGQPGVNTHQLLLAVLGAAARGRGRRAVLHELSTALTRTGRYSASGEELTPVRRDPVAALPLLLASLATLIQPGTWPRFTTGSVASYALSGPGWRRILALAAAPPGPHPDADGG